MALDVSGSQIYAGRYHYRRSEMPDLFREDVVQSRREKKSFKEQYSVDTVTFSEEADRGRNTPKSNTDIAWSRKTYLFIAGIRKDHKC